MAVTTTPSPLDKEDQTAIFDAMARLIRAESKARANGWDGTADYLARAADCIEKVKNKHDKERQDYLIPKKEWRQAELEPGGRREEQGERKAAREEKKK